MKSLNLLIFGFAFAALIVTCIYAIGGATL